MIYASELHAALPALIGRALCGARLVYHEHDSPDHRQGSQRGLSWEAYRRLAREAEVCVLPQAQRLELFVSATGRQGQVALVWNCPSLGEVALAKAGVPDPLAFYFHGSINDARLPLGILDALAAASPSATLTIAGYEPGGAGYLARFLTHAAVLGLANRVRYAGTLAGRAEILALAGRADVGLAFMPAMGDVNMVHMVGASNKPFDYLSQGLMLLVSDLAEWRETFIDPGYGLACDPADAASLERAMRWCVASPDKVRAMGEAGRGRILADWNYEAAFAPVLARLEAA